MADLRQDGGAIVHRFCACQSDNLLGFYGLDWIATVPPTVKLSNQPFGERDGPIVFGWVLVAHQAGAAVAAYGAGVIREQVGTYTPAFVLAGAFAVLASLVFVLGFDRTRPTRSKLREELAPAK